MFVFCFAGWRVVGVGVGGVGCGRVLRRMAGSVLPPYLGATARSWVLRVLDKYLLPGFV